MNEYLLIDAVGFLDEELLADHLERKWEIRNKVKKDWSIKRWSTIAASFILVSASVLLYYRFAPKPEIPSTDPKPPIYQTEAATVEPPSVQTDPPGLNVGVMEGVIFDSKIYYIDGALSKTATEENLGEMLGQMSLGTVYAYIPDDNETNRIIIKHKDGFTVFSFDTYRYDGTDGWLANLLGNAVSIEVRDTEPKYDTDFRHIGLMHSDDEGKTWDFDRWVMTGYEPSLTKKYNPNDDCMIGQQDDLVKFGCGDFSIFVEPDGDYIYLFYSKLTIDISAESAVDAWQKCEGCVARCLKRTDGTMGDFVKYYNGAFCEAGNLGRETAIMDDCWHPRVVYSEPLDLYIMTSKPLMGTKRGLIKNIDEKRKVCQFSTSKDLVNWTEPVVFYNESGIPFGNHYNAIISEDDCQPNVLKSNEFSILCNHNATLVERYKAKIV